MSRLLYANFARLKKDKVFWIAMLFMFGFGVIVILNNYMEMKKYEGMIPLDYVFFAYAMIVGIVVSAFVSLYIGTEYSDGTIRNKLIIGHMRSCIYLSNLFTCIVAAFFMIMAYMIPAGILGRGLLGKFDMGIKAALIQVLGSLVMVAAMCAIFTLLGMLIQNKAISAIAAVGGIFVFLFAAIYLFTALSQPETYSGYELDANGQVTEAEEEINPDYISGTRRVIYETLVDVLPTGQSIQYSSSEVESPGRLALYSAVITVVVTGLGVVAFQRKDLK